MKNTTYLIYLMVLLVVAVSCSDNAVRPDSKQDEQILEEFSSMEDGLITLESGSLSFSLGIYAVWPNFNQTIGIGKRVQPSTEVI